MGYHSQYMTMNTIKEIFQEYLPDYLKGSKIKKQAILDKVCEITKFNRKAAIRKFKRLQKHSDSDNNKRGRKIYYTPDVTAALKTIWEAANEPCGELLFPIIPEYIQIFKRDKQWEHSDVATKKLLQMKEHTVRRRAAEFIKAGRKGKGISTTRPSQLKSIIPIFKGPWDDLKPGYGQIDTIAHCGNTLLGDFIYTVNYTDTATYWVISRAQWNKGQLATINSMETIIKMLPVPCIGLHPDTGSEFINWHAKRWCDSKNIKITRSEPGKKNDNMYVEERNGHVVRKYLGYIRLDNIELVDLINEMYDVLADYLNHFQTVRRTTDKKRIGAKIKRKYEKVAKTPYQRMLDNPDVTDNIKRDLQAKHIKMNPLNLKEKIYKLISKINKIQLASKGN